MTRRVSYGGPKTRSGTPSGLSRSMRRVASLVAGIPGAARPGVPRAGAAVVAGPTRTPGSSRGRRSPTDVRSSWNARVRARVQPHLEVGHRAAADDAALRADQQADRQLRLEAAAQIREVGELQPLVVLIDAQRERDRDPAGAALAQLLPRRRGVGGGRRRQQRCDAQVARVQRADRLGGDDQQGGEQRRHAAGDVEVGVAEDAVPERLVDEVGRRQHEVAQRLPVEARPEAGVVDDDAGQAEHRREARELEAQHLDDERLQQLRGDDAGGGRAASAPRSASSTRSSPHALHGVAELVVAACRQRQRGVGGEVLQDRRQPHRVGGGEHRRRGSARR